MAAKNKKLTIKEARLVKAKAKGKTHKEAYKEAGYSLDSSEKAMVANTDKTLKKPHVKAALERELKRQGITVEAIVRPVADGLKAEKVTIVGNGDQAMAEVTPDHNIRLRSTQIASKWMGLDQEVVNPGAAQFVQVIQEQNNKYV